ncbi:hypothetical protein FQN54_007015 [Arachnomyces sp. PD_36]|nr:hypothetical protein FQN54_007015 [Arachnomyces sp. PD_36]
MRDGLTAKRLGSRECNFPFVKRYSEADAGTIIPFIIASLVFLARMAARCARLGGAWGPDDYTIIVAYALAIVIFSLNISMVHYGFGQNMWDIVPQDNITKAFKHFFAFVLAYKALISLAKISVCLFLLRIFQSNVFRYITYSLIAVNASVAIVWILVDSFHCLPVHLAWTGWETPEAGQCIDFIASTYVNGIVNIAVDLVMVTVPVYEVLKLKLSRRKKLGVAVMFAVGLILTAVGIARVVVFSFNDDNVNPTLEMEPLNFLSVIECQVAISCACLPATRAIIAHYLPGILNSSDNDTSTSRRVYPSWGLQSKELEAATNSPRTEKGGFISKSMSYSVDIGAKSPSYDSDEFIKLPGESSERV